MRALSLLCFRRCLLFCAALVATGAAVGCAHHTVVDVAEPAAAQRGTVVLLHGLGRGVGSMRKLERALVADGYRVCAIGYPSTRFGPPELLRQVTAAIEACAPDGAPLHMVTHSLGGILARAWAHEYPARLTGRVVMLAPPNHGSELGDLVERSGLLRAVLGPTGADLGTGPRSFPNRLGPAAFPLGVLAGTKSRHPLGSVLIGPANDGTVSVPSARLAGMHDFATVPRAHSFIMGAPEVINEVRAFLATGCFSRQHSRVVYDKAGRCARRVPG